MKSDINENQYMWVNPMAQNNVSSEENHPITGQNFMPAQRPNVPAVGMNPPDRTESTYENENPGYGQAFNKDYGNNDYGAYSNDMNGAGMYDNGMYNDGMGYNEYPTIECKSAAISFWNVIFTGIFAVIFSSVGVIIPLSIMSASENTSVGLMCIPFALVGIGSAFITVKNLVNHFKVKRRGTETSGVVCGYMDDSVRMNGVPAQIVRILIDTPVGKRYINYKLGKAERPYMVGSRVAVRVVDKYFLVCEDNEKIPW